MLKYEIREICGDWAIYEVRETETEGGERCLLILNSRANAEYVKAILEHEARYPNAAERYFPRAELMSDAEVLAVFRMCATDEVGTCDKCPLKGWDVCRRGDQSPGAGDGGEVFGAQKEYRAYTSADRDGCRMWSVDERRGGTTLLLSKRCPKNDTNRGAR